LASFGHFLRQQFFDPSDGSASAARQIVLPNAEHAPSQLHQRSVHAFVARLICRQFGFPESPVSLWNG